MALYLALQLAKRHFGYQANERLKPKMPLRGTSLIRQPVMRKLAVSHSKEEEKKMEGLRVGRKSILTSIFLILLILSGIGPANAVPIVGMPLDVSWSVTLNQPAGLFEYRYNVKNTGAAINDGLRLTIGEDRRVGGHAGTHDEQNFQNNGGLFNYDWGWIDADGTSPFPHNYDWNKLDIAANGEITIGFDDVHGPTSEIWQIELGGGAARRRFLGPLMPVPGKAGGQLLVDLGGGKNVGFTFVGGNTNPVQGGFDYIYFLKNTGTEKIDNQHLADFFLNEHPTHNKIVPAAGTEYDFAKLTPPNNNNLANNRGVDYKGPQLLPVGIGPENIYWEGLGAGGNWNPGQIIKLGFFDQHGPGALQGWAARIHGSDEEQFFNDVQSHPDVDFTVKSVIPEPIPEPCTLLLLGSGVAGLVGLGRKRLSGKRKNV